MDDWFRVSPDLIKIGDRVLLYDYDLEATISLEVLKICPKTVLVMKFDKLKGIERPVYVPYHKLSLSSREVEMDDKTPSELKNIVVYWGKLFAGTEESGYFTHRAGFYFIYDSILWFLRAPHHREGKYLPYVDRVEYLLRHIGATHIHFDVGDLD